MKKSQYTEEQIIGMLKQHEVGVKTADVCREHGVSAATFYLWKQKYGGMDRGTGPAPIEEHLNVSGTLLGPLLAVAPRCRALLILPVSRFSSPASWTPPAPATRV